MASAIAERVTFSVGAEPERLEWSLAQGRAVRAEKGLSETDISWGAQLLVVCHPDADTALEVAMRFAPPLAPLPGHAGQGRRTAWRRRCFQLRPIREGYDMTRHGVIEERIA